MAELHPDARGVRLLEMEFRRMPTWVPVALLLLLVLGQLLPALPLGPAELLTKIEAALGGGMSRGAIASVIALLLMAAALRCGGVRASELGLGRQTVGPAVFVTVAVWLVAVVFVELASNLWVGHLPSVHRFWSEMGVRVLAGAFAAALVMSAVEELVFRGVLFPQVYLRLAGARERPRVRLAVAVLATQGLFALLHVPGRLHAGGYGSVGAIVADQALLLFAGCFGILVLIATRNLAMMIGFHALYNAPVPLIAAAPGVPRLGSRVAVVVVGMVFMAVWLWYLYRRSEKSTAIPEVSVVLKPDRIPASGG